MNARLCTKLVRAGNYLAEVDVELILTDDDWSPYLSVQDASKLDKVRAALEQGDVKAAMRLARVFTLTPVAV
ncbi:MAG: hypothetical protein FJY85_12455 [Deltaproteobacteria bacterium]|nr:hypothetical protein [Deltaproteobacteria bacterium]